MGKYPLRVDAEAISSILTLAIFGPTKGSISIRTGLSSDEIEEGITHLSREKFVTVVSSEEMVYITDRGMRLLKNLQVSS